ncbi:3-hydroxyacyl-CoA dehydrogenase family protein [Noviherbaspirillum sedimenti]|uniref:3-hydroxyacyl-CoA dehydrogenase family protein n=1 Tax=Noviherbaspirillum sedimenti TaxID=2320865 RepID=A0A3A3GB88_9BURK|nr:3-hydroxyacyl-CoA dehydrogenase family protein [Noviherbaspirillum sedimenti]RJG03922.1 3-hydroxyacyl-CoA dehydrogenase family protein [Noviherbaspirillum sedimenti]
MQHPLSVTVIGAGLMGHGIAQVFARAGNRVTLTDPNQAALDAAVKHIARNLAEMKIASEPVLANIATESELSRAVMTADLVIEAVPEKLALKQRIFTDVAKWAPGHAILASNTSVIPITLIGESLDANARARLLGMHWWNPPHLIPLVEVIRTAHTSLDVFQAGFDLLLAVGKLPVKVHQDVAGFIGNRLQHALWREAFALIEAGVCDAETIDIVIKNSFGMRLSVLGPMENADLVGLDLIREVHAILFPDLNCSKAPSPLLSQCIEQGNFGMKSGKGLRTWTPQQAEEVRHRLATLLISMNAPAGSL